MKNRLLINETNKKARHNILPTAVF